MAPLTKAEVENYLSKVDLRTPLETGLNAAVSNQTMAPSSFFSAHFASKDMAMAMGCAAPAAYPNPLPLDCTASPSPPDNAYHHFLE